MIDPLKLVETATSHAGDPTYLPLLLLALCIGGGAWLFKWLVSRLEKQTTLLESLFIEANRGRNESSSVVAVNTKVIEEVRDTICENTEVIRRIRETLERKSTCLAFGLILILGTGCSHFKRSLVNTVAKIDTNRTAIEEQSRALTTGTVDVLSQAPTNRYMTLALDFARRNQQLQGIPQERIDVNALLAEDHAALGALKARYDAQAQLLDEKAKLTSELEATKSKLVEMGQKYEVEHNRSIVSRVWHWAIGTLGIGGLIALCVLCPAVIPIVGKLLAWIVSKVPSLAGAIGVVGKDAFDAVVRGVEKAKAVIPEAEKQKLSDELSKTMDAAHKALVSARKPQAAG